MKEIMGSNQEIKLFTSDHRPFFKKRWFVVLSIFVGIILLWLVVSAGIAFYNVKTGNFDLKKISNEEELNRRLAAGNLDPEIYTFDDPALGNKDANIWIVEFSDFGCPFCKQAAPIMRELLAKFPDSIYYIYRDFPIDSLHPEARLAAEAAQCAGDQGKFWSFHDRLFSDQNKQQTVDLLAYAEQLNLNMSVFNDCLSSRKYYQEVEDDRQAGVNAGITGSPTFFVNGNKVEGVIPMSAWEELINQARSDTK